MCPGWVRTALIEKQIELRAEQQGVSIEEAATDLLREKQPSLEFVAVSLCCGCDQRRFRVSLRVVSETRLTLEIRR